MFAYDGTLVPYSSLPSLCRPPRSLLNCLAKLSENEANAIYLLSGRDRNTLGKWFSKLKIGLSAEYGYFLKKPFETEWAGASQNIDMSWKDTIRPILQYYTRRTPGSSVEEAEMHLTWHYRNADTVFGGIQARELLTYLDNLPLDVVLGDRTLAVRSRSVNPTATVRRVISELQQETPPLDFLLLLGDAHINPQDLPNLGEGKVYTCAVGRKTNREKYYFNDTQEVLELISKLALLSEQEAQHSRPSGVAAE